MATTTTHEPVQTRDSAKFDEDLAAPLDPHVLVYHDLRDSRTRFFWFLMLTGHVSFVFWIMIGTSLSSVPLTYNAVSKDARSSDVTSRTTQTFIDLWFAGTLGAAIDAMTVVATFNTTLIRRFHYAVSQRIMLLASMLSCIGMVARDKKNAKTQYCTVALIAACAVYAIFNYILDRLEKVRYPFTSAFGWDSPSQYIRRFGRAQSTWSLALLHATVVTAFGLFLTMFTRPPWSSIAPTALIVFEWVYLSSLKTKRTPRYLLFGSPPFHASICVHWGVTPIWSSPQLSIEPSHFIILLILGRILLDVHLKTILKSRRDFGWARTEVLFSTRMLLAVCASLYALESVGVRIITYIKPIAVLVFFLVANGGFLWVACYHVAMGVDGTK